MVADSEKSMKVAPPEPFSFIAEEWPKYKKRFVRYMTVSGNNECPEKNKVDCLLYCMGEKAEDVIIQFGKEDFDYETLLSKFDAFFAPQKNVIFERFKFNSRMQKEGEKFDDFVTDLHKLAEYCQYGSIKEEMIRDRLVIGIADKSASDRMLLKSELTLEKATQIGKQAEIQKEETKVIRGDAKIADKEEDIVEVNRIRSESLRNNYKKKDKCWFCGLKRHSREQCPAYKVSCHKCQRIGHFSKCCKSRNIREIENKGEKELEVSFCTFKDKYLIDIGIFQGARFIDTVNFLIDTGADISAVSEQVAVKFNLLLDKCSDIVKGPDGSKLQVVGTVKLKLKYKDKSFEGKIYVIKDLKTAILGRPSIDSMNIISICAVGSSKDIICYESVSIEKEFPHIFNDLGVFKDEFHIQLVKNPNHYVHATPRNVSIPLLPKVKTELDRLQSLGIVSPIEEATDFVSPIVVVLRNEKVRICGDYTELNKNILRPVYPIPKVENTLAKLKGAVFFSKIDATSGFHQIKLDESSKKLTTVITPFGRYVYNRLPFGLNCAPEYFSMKFSNLFRDLKVAIHMDDILIFEQTKEEHDRVLREVLGRLHKEGLTINRNKCVFGVQEVTYLGHLINEKGIQVDPDRIKAINAFKTPASKKQLLQFLGMVNFVGRFISKRSHMLQPLYALLKEDNLFSWGELQDNAFKEIKEKLKQAPILVHYDPGKKIIVSADSSCYGLGAALLQEDKEGNKHVVMYASRTLTATERNYAQIEKECLALTWAAEKFKDYILGIHIILETDHKPLLQILQTKQLNDLTPRLLRLRLKLTKYNYEVKYTPGKDLVVADALSRSPMPYSEHTQMFKDQEWRINLFINETLPSDTLNKIKEEQIKCDICVKLRQFTIQGWPRKNQLGIFKNYYQYKENFSVESDLLLFDSRIVIPKSMQGEILNRIHEGHLGISKCRERAKQSVWWLGLSKEIEGKVKNCSRCIEGYTNHKEKLIIEPLPDRPWQKVGVDLFKFNNNWYMVMIDYYSRFLEIIKLKDLTEDTVIVKCKEVFSRYGIPEIVRSDCGTQFKTKFNNFAQEYGFKSITSSPYYSQSNGMAEAGVKIAKSLLSKNSDVHLALLVYRNTPLELGYSPAELMFSRKLRDNLPVIPNKLNKPVTIAKEFKEKQLERKHKSAFYYNKRHRASSLPELQINDKVWVTDLKTYGTVIKKCIQPRSYIVNTEKGQYRRNRVHLNKTTKAQKVAEDTLDNNSFYESSYSDSEVPENNSNSNDQHADASNVNVDNNDQAYILVPRKSERLVTKPKYLQDYEC